MLTGMEPPARSELPRIEDRISFFYTDNCRLEKDDGAIRIEIGSFQIMKIPAINDIALPITMFIGKSM